MKRGIGAVSIIAGTVVFWRVGLLMNTSSVLSATDTQLTLENRVASLEKRVVALESNAFGQKASKSTVKSATKEAFLSLADGVLVAGDWARIPGTEFWFDQSLYGNVTKVTWEGYLQVKDGNGIASARLYDVTNNRAVDFSEINITSGVKSSFFSLPLAIWRGQNQYRVEVKSSTGYGVSITQARLRIGIN